ncbi:MAG: HAD hydrolase-like protein [bacterium]|nr:HAD hydrolase-like protein [bacterium]
MTSNRNTYLALDIDGTVFDSGDIVAPALELGVKEFVKKSSEKISIPSQKEILSTIGMPVYAIFQQLFPGLSTQGQWELSDAWHDSLVSMIEQGGGIIFDGVSKTLESLFSDGYTILVASNGLPVYVEAILNTHNLRRFFSEPMIYPGGAIDNKSGVVKYYIDNVSKNDLIIMIGDRFTDREAASDNNIPFIGCAFGHAGQEEIKGSRWIVDEFSALPGVIREIEAAY